MRYSYSYVPPGKGKCQNMCPISVTTARNQRYPQVHGSEIRTSTQVQPWSLLQTMQPFQDLSSQTMFISVFVFQIDPFQDVSFQTISFSGGVFSDYILFKPCLVILYPFQHLSLLTISSSETTESALFFSASLT